MSKIAEINNQMSEEEKRIYLEMLEEMKREMEGDND